jgi:hypothetical protein
MCATIMESARTQGGLENALYDIAGVIVGVRVARHAQKQHLAQGGMGKVRTKKPLDDKTATNIWHHLTAPTVFTTATLGSADTSSMTPSCVVLILP